MIAHNDYDNDNKFNTSSNKEILEAIGWAVSSMLFSDFPTINSNASNHNSSSLSLKRFAVSTPSCFLPLSITHVPTLSHSHSLFLPRTLSSPKSPSVPPAISIVPNPNSLSPTTFLSFVLSSTTFCFFTSIFQPSPRSRLLLVLISSIFQTSSRSNSHSSPSSNFSSPSFNHQGSSWKRNISQKLRPKFPEYPSDCTFFWLGMKLI